MKAVVTLAALLWLAPPNVAPEPVVRVIVHPSVATARITRNAIASAYLNGSTRWGNGQAVVPVDQSVQSPVRAAFSTDVLTQPVAAVQAHWSRQILTGQGRPPVVRVTDEDVVGFVSKTPGAIGYVSPSTVIDSRVKELLVEP